jgi:hypothetical protein
MTLRTLGMFFLGLVLGCAMGAWLFVDTRARTFAPAPHCLRCLSAKELGGLLVSVGVHKVPGLLPSVVEETDKTIAIKSPEPLATIDYLVLPKKDILDLGDLSADDAAYVADAFEVMADLVRAQHLTDYKVITNGPGFQQVRYLHFHLLAQ